MSATQTLPTKTHDKPASTVDAVIVGAGFAGMYMQHRLRSLGLSVRNFEAATGVGGTWFWNRYPGARCDVESMQYSFSFLNELQQEWKWSEKFAAQPEILRYANHVADRLDLRRHIEFETRVTDAVYDEENSVWQIRTQTGEMVTARYCIMAVGCLSSARTPDFKGLENFKGQTYHTGEFPHEGVDFTGKRVGVIGTGSSAIQAIPVIAEQAAHLTVFQRTPNFSIPSRNTAMPAEYEQWWKANYPEQRLKAREMRTGVLNQINEKGAMEVSDDERRQTYEDRWAQGGTAFMASFSDLIVSKPSNDTAVAFVHNKIRSVVTNPAVAELLLPKNHPIGTKRICVDTNYYQTYNRANVTLVDIKGAPIEEITPNGLRTGGQEYEFDAIVFATGFDAMTGSLLKMGIVGRGGRQLSEKWAAGPRTYLGLMTAGFPNLFLITGPGSPSVLSNMIVSIEQHVDWVVNCVTDLRANGMETIEATEAAENNWVEHVNEMAFRTLYPGANSWYMGANIPGKPQVFMPYIGGVGAYRHKCTEIANRNYEGFHLAGQTAAVAAE